jgi:dTDP-4-amino-4,6-dideoxygalactose transaminase
MTLPSDQDASGRSFGAEEAAALERVLASGVLFSPKGTAVKGFERAFANALGAERAVACSSGSAAVHAAIAAVDPEPGEEIVTTSVTDMGALTPILFQGAVPVFADVDPATLNVTAATIEPCLSERTRAIVVTHLFGNPCDMAPILALAAARGVPVIEDAAQALGASYDGCAAGTLGALGCFSLQQGKHITTGEGGVIVAGDPALGRRAFLFVNKAWGYGDEKPDHYFLALNYRMSELQGAVAAAQLPKLAAGVTHRVAMAAMLSERLAGLDGIAPPAAPAGGVHSYWKYCLRVDTAVVRGGAPALAVELKGWGVASAPRYIVKPAFACEVFARRRTFGSSSYPFTLARPEALDYRLGRFPGTVAGLEGALVLPWNERLDPEHVEYLADAVRAAHAALAGRR